MRNFPVKVVCIHIGFLLILGQNVQTKRNFGIGIPDLKIINHNPAMAVIDEVRVAKDSRGNAAISCNMRIMRNISEFTARTSIDMLRKDNSKINLMNFNLSGCSVLNSQYKNNMIDIGVDELIRATKPPLLCPLIAGTVHVMKDYTVRPERLPPAMPLMKFIARVDVWVRSVHCTEFILTGNVHRKN